jgi:hypothetical protein
MKAKSSLLSTLIFVLFLNTANLFAQQSDPVVSAFDDYGMVPREVAYLSLNKSTYIKGESIGFTAYVLDKKTKKNSLDATNLYVSIEDDDNKIVAQKLLKLKSGVSSNIFEIDSSFTSGYYTIKAYTNWMRNFDEQDFFVETFRVIDPSAETSIETELIKTEIDAQFLPESGHLVELINNTIGVVVKDKKGYGVPNASGKVYDNTNILISEFKLNALGIGRFLLLPERNKTYKVVIDYNNNTHSFQLNHPIEPVGVTLSVKEFKDKVYITLNTNQNTLVQLQNKGYKLTLHNGDRIDSQSIYFNDYTTITKTYEVTQLPTGINIFTLFNESDQPVAERLFFNYNGVENFKPYNVTAQASKDSVKLKVNFKNIDPEQFNTLSVSVLPSDTRSFKRHHNILSYTYLQPYVKGHIENAKYYFTNVSYKTKFDMDNLLLTQGWSSYDWDAIFNNSLTFKYPFEQGITLKANINEQNISPKEAYMVRGPNNEEPNIFRLEKGEKSFMVKNVFLSDGDSIFISKMGKNRKLTYPKLYLQSVPNRIPYFDNSFAVLNPKEDYQSLASLKSSRINTESISNIQQLEEVVIVSEYDKAIIRTQELQKGRFGDVKVITRQDRMAYFFLEDYMQTQAGIITNKSRTNITFFLGRSISSNSGG